MASKSQRRKEKHKRKRDEKKAQLRKRHEVTQRLLRTPMPVIPTGSQARHQQRVLAQKPVAWDGESPEDVAVFDDTVASTLSAELASQATSVREALQLASDSQGDAAMQRVAAIPRSSPYSEWRLFVKGLVAWLANDSETASNSWGRLDSQRRPGRMAAAMMCSLKTNLEQVRVGAGNEAAAEGPIDWTARLDDTLLYHAKLLRRERFDRTAIRLAEAGLRVPEEDPILKIGLRKLEWLVKFKAEFQDSEPELVAALHQVALQRVAAQPYVDAFQYAVRVLKGPAHDPNHLWLSSRYYSRFQEEELERRSDSCFERYLQELPKYESIPKPLRGALASLIYLAEAESETCPKQSTMERMMFGPAREDQHSVRKNFKAAIKAYPGNRAAYQQYVEWVQGQDDGLTQKEREPLMKELCEVMQAWSKGLPDDTEPRLWLLDYLLEEERTEEVKPHVDWLAASRQDNPHVRAAPWKWNVLEAMRLCRQKARCAQAIERLQEAERCWPNWIAQDWLPYLHAGVALRPGDTAACQQQREAIWQQNAGRQNSLVDSCMMLGAAQQMRVAPADLKPLRAPVDAAVKNLNSISLDELLNTVSFFWDLHRTNLQYPAYRMHGKKIVDATLIKLSMDPKRILENLDDKRIQAALLLGSEMRCFEANYQVRLPKWFGEKVALTHPICVAAVLNSFLRKKYRYSSSEHLPKAEFLRDAAQTETDPFYRYWYVSLADRLDEIIKSMNKGGFGLDLDRFADMFAGIPGQEDDDDDDDEDDDDDDY